MTQQMDMSKTKKILYNPLHLILDGKDDKKHESTDMLYNYLEHDQEYESFIKTATITHIGENNYQVKCDKGVMQMKIRTKNIKSIQFLAFILHFELCNFNSVRQFETKLNKYSIDDLKNNEIKDIKFIDMIKERIEIGHLYWSGIKYGDIFKSAISYTGYKINNMQDLCCEYEEYELEKSNEKIKYRTICAFVDSKTKNIYDNYFNELNIRSYLIDKDNKTFINGINEGYVIFAETEEDLVFNKRKEKEEVLVLLYLLLNLLQLYYK